MDRQILIKEFQKVVVEVYKEHALKSLRGLEDKYELNGRSLLSWHSEVTRKSSIKHNGKFSYYQNMEDLIFCSDEILYFTAHLFLYRPFLNDPIKDGYLFSGKMIYPNFQNLEAKRYSMFADVVSQKTYNYWDRIGDLIASFFPTLIKSHEVNFSKAIEIIPVEFHFSLNFQWLKRFKEIDYPILNKIRRQIVHYTTSDTDFKHKHLERTDDKDAMTELLEHRKKLADFYKEHIDRTLLGLEKALLFFEEINLILFRDID